jgi:hypothetical protein
MSDIVNGKPAASRPFYQLRERMHSEVLLILPAGAGCRRTSTHALKIQWFMSLSGTRQRWRSRPAGH